MDILNQVYLVVALIATLVLLPKSIGEGVGVWKKTFGSIAKRPWLRLTLLVFGFGTAIFVSWKQGGLRFDILFVTSLVLFALVVVYLIRDFREPSKPEVVHTGYQDPAPTGFKNWEAFHKIGTDATGWVVRLWVRSTNAQALGEFSCVVQNPEGHAARSRFHYDRDGTKMLARMDFQYPEDFDDSPDELSDGNYIVKWLVGYNRTLLAMDEFILPPEG